MKVILFLLAILAFLAGFGILAAAKGAIHEIEAFILFLISAVFLSGAAIMDAVHALTMKMESLPSAAKSK